MKKLLSFWSRNRWPFIMLTVGAVTAALAVEEFLAPNNIFDGGVVGVSMIIGRLLHWRLGIITVVINIPFLIYALRSLGREFIVKTAYAMALFSICISIFESFQVVTRDDLLATVFGGVLLGAGVGMVLRGGGCLDGTEIVGIMVNKKTAFSTGQVVFMINIVIYTIAGILFGVDHGMYSMLMYFITSKIIDIVEVGIEQAKAIMVISEEGERIATEIYKRFGRTVTFIRGEGLVSGTKKDVLYCVITRAEIYDMRKMVKEMDFNAFITISDVSEIIGRHIKSQDGI